MGLLSIFKDKKNLAAGLTLAGVSMILSKLLLKWLAPIVIAAFGVYRVIIKKKYIEGASAVAVAILLWILLSWRLISNLLSLMMFVGVFLCLAGVFLLAVNRKGNSDI